MTPRSIAFPGLLLMFACAVTSLAWSNDNEEILRDYIRTTYGNRLDISASQIEQLTWVMSSPAGTPEKDSLAKAKPTTVHREVPRALARLFSLQRLRSGTDSDYEAFVAPQKGLGKTTLNRESFDILSSGISRLDEESYETLEAVAIISAVTLSPMAREKASAALRAPYPEDSEKFLSLTATKAAAVYPLAREVIQKYKSDGRRFRVAYLPDSHLRHMMYNEGSVSMYTSLREGIRTGKLQQADLDLWYSRWVMNIAGFRGHLSSPGSLYLTQDTFMAMNQLKGILDRLGAKPDINPMAAYLGHRARWLGLYSLSKNRAERDALASLGATLRLFSPGAGKELQAAFHQLSLKDQQRWLQHVEQQMTVTGTPAPTYFPALLGNALEITSLVETLQKVLPVFLNAMEEEQRLRRSGRLAGKVPVSFRTLSVSDNIQALLSTDKPPAITIDDKSGLVTLQGH